MTDLLLSKIKIGKSTLWDSHLRKTGLHFIVLISPGKKKSTSNSGYAIPVDSCI